MPEAPARIVLVTGASRGIGAAVAQKLASADTHVIVGYRNKAEQANAIAEAIRAAGGHASTLGADISDEADAAAMMESIETRFGRLDALVLNASGGLETGADAGYAMRLNRDAQRHLTQLALPMMTVDGRIVFVTSHQAHFFPNKAVPQGYSAVAASRRAGETALYAMRSVFSRAGVRLSVVSGDEVDARRTHGGLPTVNDFADAIVSAVTTTNSQGIVYVRGADYLMTA